MATERKRNRERRSISTARPRNYSDLYKNDHTGANLATGVSAATAGGAAFSPREAATIDWSKEYAHITDDFRRLLIVSAILFGLIIAAGFFI